MATRVSVTPGYFVGAVVRLLFVTVLLLAAFSLLVFLDFEEQTRQGVPIANINEVIASILLAWTLLAVPAGIVVLISEFQLLLLRAARWSISWCAVMVPLSMAIIGGMMGYLLFVAQRDPAPGIAARMFVLGSALAFFLAGSFHVWFYQTWARIELHQTPVGWYAAALVLAGGFLGSMIAWQAPSPYIARVIQYYEETWRERSAYPTLPIEKTEDPAL